MANAAAVLTKVNNALNRVTPLSYLVYSRVTTIDNGGDPLIGKVRSTYVDTLLSPQPAVVETGRRQIAGRHDSPESLISLDGSRFTADDFTLTVSASSISEAQMKQKNLLFVLKNTNLHTEIVTYIMDYSAIELQGTIIAYTVYVRNVKTTFDTPSSNTYGMNGFGSRGYGGGV